MPNVRHQSPRNTNGSIPLFYLGDRHTFRPLARQLRANHEFQRLGLEPRIIGKVKNPYSLRCIAEHFVKTIRERQRRGPYMLMGWCAHGLLALETAQQLREQGQSVALLILLETINPERLRQQPRWIRGIARWQAKMNLMQFEYPFRRSLRQRQPRDSVSARSAARFTGIHGSLGSTLGRKSEKIDLTRSTPLEILYAAAANYLPQPYDGAVLLMRSRKGLFGFGDDTHLGWSETLGRKLEICETQGNHYSMYVEPNVKELAHQVSARLRDAERRWRQKEREGRQIA
jgi:thioesterase domain-containing protein